MNLYKAIFIVAFALTYGIFGGVAIDYISPMQAEFAAKQLDDVSFRDVQMTNNVVQGFYILGWVIVGVIALVLYKSEIRKAMQKLGLIGLVLICLFSTGCYRSFQTPILEEIETQQEGFLIPLTGDGAQQSSSNNEEFLKKNLVFAKQVIIPQQWVQTGRGDWNGVWRPAAVLIKVDKAPVTREWTADPNSGSSNRNEAVWVMTSDQVEFSTGWTCTARIATRDDAIKFLHNYPNGSLEKVMDNEIRAKIQTEFGMEVTDLPMETLRKAATPHLQKVIKVVTDFFQLRGIQITNLGITGGFVYKDKTIADTLVKVFNAEQEQFVAMAEGRAQEERNKKVQFEADGKSKAILTMKEAEAKGIKAVADAKAYEIEKAKENQEIYVQLKQLEVSKEQVEKWDGKWPVTFMGGATPHVLMQLPTTEKK